MNLKRFFRIWVYSELWSNGIYILIVIAALVLFGMICAGITY